jgi:1-acyl-sn-glycerol-3-phosphate acyltransferase
MQSFMAGVGLLAIRLRVPVIPVHLDGLFEVLSAHDRWPKPGAIRIRFGEPLSFAEDDDYRSATARIEEAVVNLAAAAGSRGTGGR